MTIESSLEALAVAINRVADAMQASKGCDCENETKLTKITRTEAVAALEDARACIAAHQKAEDVKADKPGKSKADAKPETAATPSTATPAAAAPSEKVENSEPITLKSLRPLLQKLCETKGDPAAEAVVKSLGVSRLSQLPDDALPEAKAALEKALQ